MATTQAFLQLAQAVQRSGPTPCGRARVSPIAFACDATALVLTTQSGPDGQELRAEHIPLHDISQFVALADASYEAHRARNPTATYAFYRAGPELDWETWNVHDAQRVLGDPPSLASGAALQAAPPHYHGDRVTHMHRLCRSSDAQPATFSTAVVELEDVHEGQGRCRKVETHCASRETAAQLELAAHGLRVAMTQALGATIGRLCLQFCLAATGEHWLMDVLEMELLPGAGATQLPPLQPTAVQAEALARPGTAPSAAVPGAHAPSLSALQGATRPVTASARAASLAQSHEQFRLRLLGDEAEQARQQARSRAMYRKLPPHKLDAAGLPLGAASKRDFMAGFLRDVQSLGNSRPASAATSVGSHVAATQSAVHAWDVTGASRDELVLNATNPFHAVQLALAGMGSTPPTPLERTGPQAWKIRTLAAVDMLRVEDLAELLAPPAPPEAAATLVAACQILTTGRYDGWADARARNRHQPALWYAIREFSPHGMDLRAVLDAAESVQALASIGPDGFVARSTPAAHLVQWVVAATTWAQVVHGQRIRVPASMDVEQLVQAGQVPARPEAGSSAAEHDDEWAQQALAMAVWDSSRSQRQRARERLRAELMRTAEDEVAARFAQQEREKASSFANALATRPPPLAHELVRAGRPVPKTRASRLASTHPADGIAPHYYRTFRRDLYAAEELMASKDLSLGAVVADMRRTDRAAAAEQKAEIDAAKEALRAQEQAAALARANRQPPKPLPKTPYNTMSLDMLQYFDWDSGRKAELARANARWIKPKPPQPVKPPPTPPLTPREGVVQMFAAADGVTQVPYVVLGKPDPAAGAANFVVLPGMFDTYEQFRHALVASISQSTTSQILLLNLPGQAHTRYSRGALSDRHLATLLHELLQHLNEAGTFLTTLAACTRALERAAEAEERKLIDAGKRTHMRKTTNFRGQKTKPRTTDEKGRMFPGSVPLRFHIVSFGYSTAAALSFTMLYGATYKPLLGAILAVGGLTHIPDELAVSMERLQELFGALPDQSDGGAPLSKYAESALGAAFKAKLQPGEAIAKYLAAPTRLQVAPSQRAAQLGGMLGNSDWSRAAHEVPVPLVVVRGKHDRLQPAAVFGALCSGRQTTQHDWQAVALDQRRLGLDLDTFQPLGELELPEWQVQPFMWGHRALRALHQVLTAGLPDVAYVLEVPDVGHDAWIEAPSTVLQVMWAMSNSAKWSGQLSEKLEALEKAEAAKTKVNRLSKREQFAAKLASAAAQGVVSPLALMSPTERQQHEFLQRHAVDGRELPAGEAERRLRGGARTLGFRHADRMQQLAATRRSIEAGPARRSQGAPGSPGDAAGAASPGRTAGSIALGLSHPASSLVSAPSLANSALDELSQHTLTSGPRVLTLGTQDVTYSPRGTTMLQWQRLTGQGALPAQVEAAYDQHLHTLAEQHAATAQTQSATRFERSQAAWSATVQRLEQRTFEEQEARMKETKQRDDEAGAALRATLEKLTAELHDPAWAMDKLHAAAGVVLYGPSGPPQPVIPALDGERAAATGGASTAGQGMRGDVESAEESGLIATAKEADDLPGTAPLDRQLRAALAGGRMRLEQLPKGQLPGPAEVHPASALGKALALIWQHGSVLPHGAASNAAGVAETAADRRYLEMATLAAGRQWAQGQQASDGHLVQMTPDLFAEVVGGMLDEHDDFLHTQAALERKRQEAAARALHPDLQAARIQAAWRGHRARKCAETRRVLKVLRAKYHAAAKEAQRLARGFLARRLARRKREVRDRIMLLSLCACRIQRCFRAWLAWTRDTAERWHLAAVQIQRVARGCAGRKRAKKLGAARAARRARAHGATQLQRMWRGHIVRKDYAEVQGYQLAALAVQRWWRGRHGRSIAKSARLFLAALPGLPRLRVGVQQLGAFLAELQGVSERISALRRRQQVLSDRCQQVRGAQAKLQRKLRALERERASLQGVAREIEQLKQTKEELLNTLDHGYIEPKPLNATRQLTAHVVGQARAMGLTMSRGMERVASTAGASRACLSLSAKERLAEEAHNIQLVLHLKEAEYNKQRLQLDHEALEYQRELDAGNAKLQAMGLQAAELGRAQARAAAEKGRVAGLATSVLVRQARELREYKARELVPQLTRAATAALAQGDVRHANALAVGRQYAAARELEDAAVLELTSQFMAAAAQAIPGMAILAKTHADMEGRNLAQHITAQAECMDFTFHEGAKVKLSDAQADAQAARLAASEQQAMAEDKSDILRFFRDQAFALQFNPDLRLWTVDEVCRLLELLQLEQYVPAAREADLDGDTLADVGLDDLRDALGLTAHAHIHRLKHARSRLLAGHPIAAVTKVGADVSAEMLEARRGTLRDIAAHKGVQAKAVPAFAHVKSLRFARVQAALEAGLSPDIRDGAHSTLLHHAAQAGSSRMVSLLLTWGADPNAQNLMGNAPLHLAVDVDPTGELPKLLQGRGANPQLLNKAGQKAGDGLAGPPAIKGWDK